MVIGNDDNHYLLLRIQFVVTSHQVVNSLALSRVHESVWVLLGGQLWASLVYVVISGMRLMTGP